MIFPDTLHSSACGEVRRLIKKGDLTAAWGNFAQTLSEKRQTFDISHYSRYVSSEGIPFSLDTVPDAVQYVAGVWQTLQIAGQTAVSELPSWNDTIEKYVATATHWMATPQEESTPPLTVVLRQILGGELGFLLGNLLSELTPTRELLAAAQNFLNTSLLELLDGGGLLPARYLLWNQSLLSSWTRVAMLGNMMNVRPWKTAAQKQYEWMILQTLRQMRHDGTLVFSQPAAARSPEQQVEHDFFLRLVQDALELDTDPIDSRVGITVLPRCRPLLGMVKKNITPDLLPPAPYFSDWAAVAIMKPRWNHTDTQLITTFGGVGGNQIELLVQRHRIFSGEWSFFVEKDGVPLLPIAPWTCLCELEEPSHLYMELEIPLENRYVLQRHFLLAKEDSVLMLADSILAPEDSSVPAPPSVYCDSSSSSGSSTAAVSCSCGRTTLTYRAAIPLADGTSAVPCKKTTLQKDLEFRPPSSSSPLAKMLPLWLPDNGTCGSLPDGTFQMTATTSHPSLFVPMVFDWQKNRITRPALWRTLTVGESLQVVSPQRAVGYRIPLGKTQFLLYRSLAGTANRSVLGHNLVSDLLFARFDRTTGDVQPILEVEADGESPISSV